MMKKLLISMWIAPAVISAGTLFGTVTDAQKAPIDAAAVTVWDAATGRGLKATTANGEYSFTGLDAGSYLLKVETAGKALLLGAVEVKEGVGHELNLVMEAPAGDRVKARPPYRAPVKDAPVERPKPERFKQAKLLHQVRPVYPALAKKGGITGTVQISTVMRVDGTLDDLVVQTAPNRDLAIAALIAVRQWRYSPTLFDGTPVEVEFTIDITFSMERR